MTDCLTALILGFDALCSAPFRLLDDPVLGFGCGMGVLALASALVGRGGAAALARVQRVRRQTRERELKHHQDLSLAALKAGDRRAYLAANRLASETYGHVLALAAGRGAALVWPACAVLAWASWRFSGVPLPLVGESAGPAVFFVPLYLGANWLLGRLSRRLRARADRSRPPGGAPTDPA